MRPLIRFLRPCGEQEHAEENRNCPENLQAHHVILQPANPVDLTAGCPRMWDHHERPGAALVHVVNHGSCLLLRFRRCLGVAGMAIARHRMQHRHILSEGDPQHPSLWSRAGCRPFFHAHDPAAAGELRISNAGLIRWRNGNRPDKLLADSDWRTGPEPTRGPCETHINGRRLSGHER